MSDAGDMVRINVTLRRADLDLLDAVARERGENRSALIREAIRALPRGRYVEGVPPRKRSPEEISQSMERIAKKAGNWDPVSTLRHWRERR